MGGDIVLRGARATTRTHEVTRKTAAFYIKGVRCRIQFGVLVGADVRWWGRLVGGIPDGQ